MEYDEQDLLGKTSLQIESQYGQFDNIRAPADISGIYRNCGCGYIVVKEKRGLFGTTPAKYYMIYFDENGVAYKCALENGGIGG